MPAATSNRKNPVFVKFWLPVLACMGIIFYASSLPASDIPPIFPFQDVAFHLFIYLALGLVFARAIKYTYLGMKPARIIFLTLIFTVFYGLSDEWHQAFVPNRCVSGFDVFIDGIGGFAGGLIYLWPR